MSQNLSSAAVVIGALRDKIITEDLVLNPVLGVGKLKQTDELDNRKFACS